MKASNTERMMGELGFGRTRAFSSVDDVVFVIVINHMRTTILRTNLMFIVPSSSSVQVFATFC